MCGPRGSCSCQPRGRGGAGSPPREGQRHLPKGGQRGYPKAGADFRAFMLMTPCAPPGVPKPQITWRKGPTLEPLRGRPGLEVLDDGSLFLASVSPTDSGDYECQATNEAGSTSRRAKLMVYGKQGPQSGGWLVLTYPNGTPSPERPPWGQCKGKDLELPKWLLRWSRK